MVVVATALTTGMPRWNELDVDRSDQLEGVEVLALAEWVWGSFRPGRAISEPQRQQEAVKILQRCDKNENGVVDREEFQVFFDTVTSDMFRFHKARAKKRAKKPSTQRRRNVLPELVSQLILTLTLTLTLTLSSHQHRNRDAQGITKTKTVSQMHWLHSLVYKKSMASNTSVV